MNIRQIISSSNFHARKITSAGKNFSFDSTKNIHPDGFIQTQSEMLKGYLELPKEDQKEILLKAFSKLNDTELAEVNEFIFDNSANEKSSKDLLKNSHISDDQKEIIKNVADEIRKNVYELPDKHRNDFKAGLENHLSNHNFDCMILGLIAFYFSPTTIPLFVTLVGGNLLLEDLWRRHEVSPEAAKTIAKIAVA